MKRRQCVAMVAVTTVFVSAAGAVDYCDTEVRVVTPGVATAAIAMTAPSDAITLFDGNDLSEWKGLHGPAEWQVHDGVVSVRKNAGDIETKRSFADIQLHIEWLIPVDITGAGQLRGNSGVFFQARYELQVLDSYANRTYADGQAGAVYGQAAPLVNAMRRPGEWNVYDAIYTAPRFNQDGTVFAKAHVTVLHNGVLIQNNTEIIGTTGNLGNPAYSLHGAAPLRLQAHGDESHPVSYRNIWVRELGKAGESAKDLEGIGISPSKLKLSADSTLDQLLDNTATHEVLARCLPELVPNPAVMQAIGKMTLRELSGPIAGLTEDKLRIIGIELAHAQAGGVGKEGHVP